ncbi:MAG: hypothetical protein RIS73_564 [Bacteroidota bacterium]
MYRKIPCTIQNINKKIFVVAIQPLFLPSEKKGIVLTVIAEVAHLVEHDLAKVGVAGSSPVFRSKNYPDIHLLGFFFYTRFSFRECLLGWWNW